MSDWPIGKQLKDGRYAIESRIGTGGFGTTYRARDRRDGGCVAIKTLNHNLQERPEFDRLQECFVNEAVALASCRHPHVVRVYPQLFQEEGLWCMVMECIAGESLSDRCKRLGPLPADPALAVICQVGEALEFVHQQGFLHRDVKPQNILLRAGTGSPVLIDFGLAREYHPGQVEELTNHFTDCFAPIEQYSRVGSYGAWTDVYALAATLYVILTAELPVPARFRRQGAPLVPPSRHNAAIAPWLDRAILQGMALEPEARPQSVMAWLTILQAASQGLPAANGKLDSQLTISQPTLTEEEAATHPQGGGRSQLTGACVPFDTVGPATNLQGQLSGLAGDRRSGPATGLASHTSNMASSPSLLVRPVTVEAATFDYGTLRRCLVAGDWTAANAETYHFLLCLAGRLQAGWLRVADFAALPCGDLRAIDRLWLDCSDGHFGFSVQRWIYGQFCRDRYNFDAWKAVGERLGWRVKGEWRDETKLQFDRLAPRGHLPGWILRPEYRSGGLVVFSSLVSRLGDCDRRREGV